MSRPSLARARGDLTDRPACRHTRPLPASGLPSPVCRHEPEHCGPRGPNRLASRWVTRRAAPHAAHNAFGVGQVRPGHPDDVVAGVAKPLFAPLLLHQLALPVEPVVLHRTIELDHTRPQTKKSTRPMNPSRSSMLTCGRTVSPEATRIRRVSVSPGLSARGSTDSTASRAWIRPYLTPGGSSSQPRLSVWSVACGGLRPWPPPPPRVRSWRRSGRRHPDRHHLRRAIRDQRAAPRLPRGCARPGRLLLVPISAATSTIAESTP